MTRLLHAADLHLDSPFEGLSEARAASRRGEARALLGRIAALCQSERVDLALFSGDLFDSGGAYPETAETLRSALGGMDVPVFIAPGNHDPYTKNSAWTHMALPENVHIFKEPRLECVELPGLSLRVWGAGFTDRDCQPLLRDFEAAKKEGFTDVMCLHGEAGVPSSRYNPISEADIAASGMDYIALGHVHSFSGLRRAGNAFYAWPGCTEGRGFDETGEKGVIIADVEAGSVSVRFVPLGGHKYEILRVDAGAEDVCESVRRALPEGSENDIFRVILTGERLFAPDTAAIAHALEDRVYALSLRDATRLRRDVWERAGEDSLRGGFLKRLRERYEAAGSDDERELITQAARWGLAALDGGEEAASL